MCGNFQKSRLMVVVRILLQMMDTIDYVTIAAEGNAIDFGNLTIAKNSAGSASSSTRGLWMGGTLGPLLMVLVIRLSIEIATLGDALDFGDLNSTKNDFTLLYQVQHEQLQQVDFIQAMIVS